VRPDGYFIKDRTISSSSDNSNVTNNTACSPPLAIGYAGDNSSNNNNNNSNNNTINNTTNSITNAAISGNNNSSSSSNGISLTTLENSNELILPIAEAQAAGKPLTEALEEVCRGGKRGFSFQ